MSFLRRLVGIAAPALGTLYGGPVGGALGAAVGQAAQKPVPSTFAPVGTQPAGLVALPALPAVGGAVVAGGRLLAAGAGAVARGAVAWCRRNPAWCASVGGTAAVGAMIQEGRLPMPRRRRGRGLTARDLRSFRRTVRVIRGVSQSVGLQGRGRTRGRTIGSGHTIVQN